MPLISRSKLLYFLEFRLCGRISSSGPNFVFGGECCLRGQISSSRVEFRVQGRISSSRAEFRLQGRISFSGPTFAEFRLQGRVSFSGPDVVFRAEFGLRGEIRLQRAPNRIRLHRKFIFRADFRLQISSSRTISASAPGEQFRLQKFRNFGFRGGGGTKPGPSFRGQCTVQLSAASLGNDGQCSLFSRRRSRGQLRCCNCFFVLRILLGSELIAHLRLSQLMSPNPSGPILPHQRLGLSVPCKMLHELRKIRVLNRTSNSQGDPGRTVSPSSVAHLDAQLSLPPASVRPRKSLQDKKGHPPDRLRFQKRLHCSPPARPAAAGFAGSSRPPPPSPDTFSFSAWSCR